MTALAAPARFLHIVEALLWVPSRFMRKFIAGPPTPAALHGVSTLRLSFPYLQYDSNGTFRNVPLLLSHACPCAGWFDAYNKKACPVYNRIESPVFWDYNEHIAFLKFNQKFDAVSPQTGKEVRTRYPVVVAFHKEEELVEIRFDTLRTIFIDTQDVFYVHLISTVVNCLKREFACDLAALNLDFLVAAAQNAVLGVRLVAQNMRMANGTYAELDVGKNEDYLLPFVGELSDFLLKYQNDFERVPELKEAFENFIKEKNITSDYPWITLLWENGGKTKS